MFPISRDPPEGGTYIDYSRGHRLVMFPISRDPPEGGTRLEKIVTKELIPFPISRDPPEGGTVKGVSGISKVLSYRFPISRDPPEGGTVSFLDTLLFVHCFQFLGIPPKGEPPAAANMAGTIAAFPISRDPPEGGTPVTKC